MAFFLHLALYNFHFESYSLSLKFKKKEKLIFNQTKTFLFFCLSYKYVNLFLPQPIVKQLTVLTNM